MSGQVITSQPDDKVFIMVESEQYDLKESQEVNAITDKPATIKEVETESPKEGPKETKTK